VLDRVGLALASFENSLILTTNAAGMPPAILSHPASQIVSSGQSATLSVTFTGSAPATHQWYIGLSGDTSNPVSGATVPEFTSPPLGADTAYWVRVSNNAAYADSRSATIVVDTVSAGYNAWIATQGLFGTDIAPAADPDGDLRTNLLEYTHGSTAAKPDATAPITIDRTAGHADFHLQLRGDPALNLTCHLTPDFQNWQTTGLVFANGQWTASNNQLQVIDAQPAASGLWNLTLRHPAAPASLFLQLSADMLSPP
jgi:hypothetical protein